MVADGLGLNAACAVELEQAARVPLPGFGEVYGDDTASQKRRLLDVLLTFVVLFHQEEQTLALQDLKMKCTMFTGLTKLIEEYLTRAITRAESGEGFFLLKALQSQLRVMKQLDVPWRYDDSTHRLLLFNCCDTLAAEDNSITLPPTSAQPVSRGTAKRHKTNYAFYEDSSYLRSDWND